MIFSLLRSRLLVFALGLIVGAGGLSWQPISALGAYVYHGAAPTFYTYTKRKIDAMKLPLNPESPEPFSTVKTDETKPLSEDCRACMRCKKN
jgi:hypothetical protein